MSNLNVFILHAFSFLPVLYDCHVVKCKKRERMQELHSWMYLSFAYFAE